MLRDLSPLEEGDVVRMRPFRLGRKEWEKATVTKRYDERSYEVESTNGAYRRNRVDLKQTQTIPPKSSAASPNKPTPGTSHQPKEQRTTPAAVIVQQRPKRTIKEPAYLKDYAR